MEECKLSRERRRRRGLVGETVSLAADGRRFQSYFSKTI